MRGLLLEQFTFGLGQIRLDGHGRGSVVVLVPCIVGIVGLDDAQVTGVVGLLRADRYIFMLRGVVVRGGLRHTVWVCGCHDCGQGAGAGPRVALALLIFTLRR